MCILKDPTVQRLAPPEFMPEPRNSGFCGRINRQGPVNKVGLGRWLIEDFWVGPWDI